MNWKYEGPIFDAHTHIGDPKDLSKMIEFEREFGIKAQLAIVHTPESIPAAKNLDSNGFIFARYLPTGETTRYNVPLLLDEIAHLRERGYSLAKMWFGPRWRDFVENPSNSFRVDDERLTPAFEALEDNEIPLLIHVADPDTYFAQQYTDTSKYGTKEGNLAQLGHLLNRHRKLRFQLAHMGSQPEIHRLDNLGAWLDKYPHIVVDTASSRWMARELSKDPEKARNFFIRYSDRILFGTDLSSNRGPREAFAGRYDAQRTLYETDVRHEPLPIEDPDTKDIGGTFINGLDLPVSVLKKIYWENAMRVYNESQSIGPFENR
jgi:hypothetical protein